MKNGLKRKKRVEKIKWTRQFSAINSQSQFILFLAYMQWDDLSEIDSITITDLCENNCTDYSPANRYSQNFG